MTTIIFSKNRALQLDAFLRSYAAHVTSSGEVRVLWLATSMRHAQAYAEVFVRHPRVLHTPQSLSFKSDVLSLLPAEGEVVFFVDDMVFIRAWDGYGPPGLSLRLGLHLTYNYASGNVPQPFPECLAVVDGCVTWRWIDGQMAWGYPLSVDGHVFDAQEMVEMAASCVFHTPNTFESALQQFLPRFIERQGICYAESRVVNIPWNIVQEDWHNRHSTLGASAEEMLAHWEAGFQIDLSQIYGVLNMSVHQEFPLVLEPR